MFMSTFTVISLSFNTIGIISSNCGLTISNAFINSESIVSLSKIDSIIFVSALVISSSLLFLNGKIFLVELISSRHF